MDSSFLQSQHPVVEELLTNKYFGDTLLVCANGHLTDNKVSSSACSRFTPVCVDIVLLQFYPFSPDFVVGNRTGT